MKAYIINIELNDSRPVVWRKVVLPSGGTFNRLHEVIMLVTNFSGLEPEYGGHFYRFDLEEENSIVTNDLKNIKEHRDFQKNRGFFEERLKNIEERFFHFEKSFQKEMNMEALFPSKVKFDDYLEKYGELQYVYDYRDNWRFKITLLETVEDYYFGYPTLLDGEGDAPPENIGGLARYYDFLEAYSNPSHELHEDAVEYKKISKFRSYDRDFINSILKNLKYKKTEWNKISHDNYTVMSDKYRTT